MKQALLIIDAQQELIEGKYHRDRDFVCTRNFIRFHESFLYIESISSAAVNASLLRLLA